jgi:hypothetical protein
MVLAAAAMIVSGAWSHGKEPAWLDRTLAGYALAYDEKHAPVVVHDAKSGFFLVRDIECDGGQLSLLLTRDHHSVEGYESDSEYKLKQKPLPSLVTGKGVAIGDSESKMKSLLGSPSSHEITGSRDQFTVFHYAWLQRGKDAEVQYDEAYTFKHGKLIEIQFSRDENPGEQL